MKNSKSIEHVSDSALLHAYASDGSEEAFAELVRRSLPLVYSSALRQLEGQAAAAEDVAQAVFTDLARQAKKLADHPAWIRWLFVTTRHHCLHARRTEARHRSKASAAQLQASFDLASSSGEDIEWVEVAPLLDSILSCLNERELSGVWLRYFQRQSWESVGNSLGLASNAARMKVERALDKMRRRFSTLGVQSTAEALEKAIGTKGLEAVPAFLASKIATSAWAVTAPVGLSISWTSLFHGTAVKWACGIALVVGAVWPLNRGHGFRSNPGGHPTSLELSNRLAETSALLLAAQEDNERLQKETRSLQEQTAELRRLWAERIRTLAANSPLPGTEPSPPVVSDSVEASIAGAKAFGGPLSDLGNTTPERAASSLIWAAMSGRADRVADLLQLPSSITEESAPRHYAFFSNQLSNVFHSLEFTAVQAIHPNPDGTLRLNLVYRDLKGGATNTFPFLLRRLAGTSEPGSLSEDLGWKVQVEGEVPERYRQL